MTAKKKTGPHAGCSKTPCDLCQRRERSGTCGCRRAGVLVMNETEIQKCDDCALFESDADAAAAVDALTKLLHRVYVRGGPDEHTPPEGRTVADAMDYLELLVADDDVSARGKCHCGSVGPLSADGFCEACVEAYADAAGAIEEADREAKRFRRDIDHDDGFRLAVVKALRALARVT